MIAERVVKPPQPLWRKQVDQWLKPADWAEPSAAYDAAHKDNDSDPQPAAAAVPSWPRVFPGL